MSQLQRVADYYFKKNPPVIRWGKLPVNVCGEAHYDKNRIVVNKQIPVDCLGCKVGQCYFEPNSRRIKLREGEQYYFTLLHEIDHFKLKYKPPQEFIENIASKDVKPFIQDMVEAITETLDKGWQESSKKEEFIKDIKRKLTKLILKDYGDRVKVKEFAKYLNRIIDVVQRKF